MARFGLLGCAIAAILFGHCALAEQRADPDFRYTVEQPAYPANNGPVIAVDAGHHNFHTAYGRYAPFSALARADGFQVVSVKGTIDTKALADVDILVIANAQLAGRNNTLSLISAFFTQEITDIKNWVESGGSLLLIADHVPFAGAAYDLALSFGFKFLNGFASDANGSTKLTFSSGQGLDLSAIGDQGLPPIHHVTTFTGQAIEIPPTASSILTLDGKYFVLLPTIYGRLDETAKVVDVSGYSQGSVMRFGKGKVAVFGEAAAFSAQISANGVLMGMNAPGAEENAPFVLAILRWLAKP